MEAPDELYREPIERKGHLTMKQERYEALLEDTRTRVLERLRESTRDGRGGDDE